MVELIQRARQMVGRQVEDLYDRLPERMVTQLRGKMYELLSRYYYGDDMPLTVGIETTSVCNRHCSYCPIGEGNANFIRLHRDSIKFMKDELYQFILIQLRQIPRRFSSNGFAGDLYLNGYGEPLLDPDIVERVRLAAQFLPDARIIIPSNGDNLTYKLLGQLINAGMSRLLLTPHDPNGRLQQEWIYDAARHYGHIQIRDPLRRLFNRGGTVIVDPNMLMRPVSACIAPTFSMIIDVNGEIIPCSNDPYQTMSFGNVREYRDGSLLERWYSPEWMQHRKNLRQGNWDNVHTTCQKCHNGF